MAKSVRGANSPERARQQKIHRFSMTAEELSRKNKDWLLEKAEELGVLSTIPANGNSNTPLKSDLVKHLAQLRNQTMT